MGAEINSRMRLVRLAQFLLERTDDTHPATLPDMQKYLRTFGMHPNRKTLYGDLEFLQAVGLDVVQKRTGPRTEYCVSMRKFEVPEVKLLVDSVQVSRFITKNKAEDLISKLESLCSVHQGQFLNRQVFLSNRVRSSNESIYDNVDRIYEAIEKDRKIRFHYFTYDLQRRRVMRHKGNWFSVSPFAMTWFHENYYLVAYDPLAAKLKHYRVDRMTDLELGEGPRDGKDAFRDQDIPQYTNHLFNMYGGEIRSVQLRFPNDLAGVVLDRVGEQVILIPDGPDHFTFTFEVAISPPFFGWLFSFGDQVQVLSPQSVVDELKGYLRKITEVYREK